MCESKAVFDLGNWFHPYELDCVIVMHVPVPVNQKKNLFIFYIFSGDLRRRVLTIEQF